MKNLHEEFPGLLYNKLWENVIHKENRLWTFLSVYGAAVGIVIGTRITDQSLRTETSLVILILTYWAAELILDSDWWSVRNRLMIEQIERRSGVYGMGLIPEAYRGPRYSSESITRVCLGVFALIGVVTYWIASGEIARSDLSSLQRVMWTSMLNVAAVMAILRCEHVREGHVKRYYDMYVDLRSQASVIDPPPAPVDRTVPEARDRRCATGRFVSLTLILTANAISFSKAPGEGAALLHNWFFLVNAAIAIWFVYVTTAYLDYSRKLDGKDAGFPLFNRSKAGRISLGDNRRMKQWIAGNWILAVLLLCDIGIPALALQ